MQATTSKREGTTGAWETPARPESTASTVAEKAKAAATFVGDKAEQATAAVGAGMENLGDKIRHNEPAQGVLHDAGEKIADGLESGGQYLEQQGLKGMGTDLTNFVRRNPIPALLVGVGIGVLLAQLIRR